VALVQGRKNIQDRCRQSAIPQGPSRFLVGREAMLQRLAALHAGVRQVEAFVRAIGEAGLHDALDEGMRAAVELLVQIDPKQAFQQVEVVDADIAHRACIPAPTCIHHIILNRLAVARVCASPA